MRKYPTCYNGWTMIRTSCRCQFPAEPPELSREAARVLLTPLKKADAGQGSDDRGEPPAPSGPLTSNGPRMRNSMAVPPPASVATEVLRSYVRSITPSLPPTGTIAGRVAAGNLKKGQSRWEVTVDHTGTQTSWRWS